MDLNNIGEAEDRISDLPDSLLHYILSFLETECVAKTSILSKRWNCIWRSIPTLKFFSPTSLTEINKFMDFVDRTLRLHDRSSSIQKFSLVTEKPMIPSKVHSWISNITSHGVQELLLNLDLDKPFLVPLSLFACESLIELQLYANSTTHLPKSFSLPKLKSLKLDGIQFTDDSSWNEQHFSSCPVLEDLILLHCTWFGVRNFCISNPALKHMAIHNDAWKEDGLPDCTLKIQAPNLVSLTYVGSVAKEYVLSSFQKLESAGVHLYECDVPIGDQKIGAAATKLFRALAHVRSLTIHPNTLEDFFHVDAFAYILPTFHNLEELVLEMGKPIDKSLFLLIKATPNLTRLVFYHCIRDNEEDDDNWDGFMLTAGCLFQHLRSVCFSFFCGNVWEMRWLKLILKNAKALQTISITAPLMDATCKEVILSELSSLPKASNGCVFEFL